jgi:hypothetical protein
VQLVRHAACPQVEAGKEAISMGSPQISRRRFVGAGVAGTLGVLLAPGSALAKSNNNDEPGLLRWDLVTVDNGVVIPGGADVARDAATGDVGTLTGSGQARPGDEQAAGGGTFVHRQANGREVAHGIYWVTGFNSFENLGGSLAGIGLIDAIGDIGDTSGGILSLKVHLRAVSGQSADGVLEVHCDLPGGGPTTEGIRLKVGPLDFVQQSGTTLFHILN